MNLPEYKEVLPLFLKRVTLDYPTFSPKKRKKMAEELARQFVVDLKLGLIKP